MAGAQVCGGLVGVVLVTHINARQRTRCLQTCSAPADRGEQWIPLLRPEAGPSESKSRPESEQDPSARSQRPCGRHEGNERRERAFDLSSIAHHTLKLENCCRLTVVPPRSFSPTRAISSRHAESTVFSYGSSRRTCVMLSCLFMRPQRLSSSLRAPVRTRNHAPLDRLRLRRTPSRTRCCSSSRSLGAR